MRYGKAPEVSPYISPFRSRGVQQLARLNPNVAGSYAPSSLRVTLAKVITIAGVRQDASYSLPVDHAKRASKYLLKGAKVPALALSIFLFRDYGYVLDKPEVNRTLGVFRNKFGLRPEISEEDEAFRILFSDDAGDFDNSDLLHVR